MEDHNKPDVERYDEKSLAEVDHYVPPGTPPLHREEFIKRAELRREADKLFESEKPLRSSQPAAETSAPSASRAASGRSPSRWPRPPR
jgi:hypothetical protein